MNDIVEPTKDNLASALAKAQGEMKNATLNKTNPHFKSKFADLAAVRDATIPALSKNNLSIVQFTQLREGQLMLITWLMHTDGVKIESEYPLPNQPDKPQIMGSAITYAKRYSWSAMCGIAADEDDDAEAAQSEKEDAISEDQETYLNDLMLEVGASKEGFLKYFKVKSVKELADKKFEIAKQLLEAKRKPQGEKPNE